jgi:hypothetical protein
MEHLKVLIYGEPKQKLKKLRPLQDSQGRPYYLTNLPFRKKYPLVFIFGIGISSTLIVFSGTIYHMLFTKYLPTKY